MIGKSVRLLLQKYRQYKADRLVKSLRDLTIKGCEIPYELLKVDGINDFHKTLYEELSNHENLIEWPISIKKSIDCLYSHNEIVALWYQPISDIRSYKMFYYGMAWAIPDRYHDMEIIKIFGCIPESIDKADTINLLIDIGDNEKNIESFIKLEKSFNNKQKEGISNAKVPEHASK